MIARAEFRLDVSLLAAAAALVGVGVLLIYSASSHQEAGTALLETSAAKHALFGLAGFGLLLLVAHTDYRLLGNAAPALYVVALLLLAAVLVAGDTSYGAQRWIDLKLFLLQPSELAKPLLAVVLARYFSHFREEIRGFRAMLGSLLLVAVPSGLIYLQPDLGTAAVFGSIWLGMAIMGGVRPAHLVMLVGGALAAAPLVYVFLLREYMQERLMLFLNPDQDPMGAGYNVLQSAISVGSGGLFGKGLLNGTQSQLHFLRVQKTDFIFSVLGEELGFIGALLVFGLFLVLLLRGLQIAASARDDFGRLLASGIVVMLLVQVFVNVGVNVRLLPVTGIPLPFLSAGGSSLFGVLAAVGILESIHAHRTRMNW